MKITSLKLHTSHFSANDEALLRCQTALELRDKGDYQGVREVLRPLWRRVGEHPEVKGLGAPVAAEVLLCVGILTSWIGSKEGIEDAQEVAKNLISEGIRYYESVGDVRMVAASRAEIAYCYFREGALDEARIMLTEALRKLITEGNTRARALLKLTTVEWSASRYSVALKLLTDNASLFQKVTNHTTRGNYHNELAIVLRHLAKSDPLKREDLLLQAIREFKSADHYFQLAKNKVFQATVKNNAGLIFFNLSRFKDAHGYIAEARRLAVSLRDRVLTAQFDESRAQVLIAERKFKEAEAVMRGAVRVLEKSGQQCLWADALVTLGISLARLKHRERAQFTFQKALEVAHQVGAQQKVGLAALTMIEELDQLSPDILRAAYDQADEWLAKSQSQELSSRLNAAARKLFAGSQGKSKAERPIEVLLNRPCDLQEEVTKYEGTLIGRALAKENGSLTRAAKLLKTSYQGLAYIIEARHPDLLKARTPVRRRSRKSQGR
jgi:tetratricopeptide (TPR) repeat protein